MIDDLLFAVSTPLGFTVRVMRTRWALVTTIKHPAMYGREEDVQNTLRMPDEIRRSRSDDNVLLFYRLERYRRWTCVVVKQLDDEGFLITTYPTDAIKEGEPIWTR